ncbi:hypothetical protein [Frankia sp. EI5c]|uniref:hypothetical protein n=1 Tax=Frankia sp. EI5c TaxID=683316 RepID=UPI0008253EE2|nr:hypothetical protein [Frankia sp. EI5c]
MSSERPAGAGRERERQAGSVRVAERVVAKIAAIAAADIEGVGAPPPRLLSRAGGSSGRSGLRRRLGSPRREGRPRRGRWPADRVTDSSAARPGRWPEVTAQVVDGAARVSLTLSVAYPAPVARTTEAVRSRVSERVAALAGLPVARIDIRILTLCDEGAARVR